MVDVASFTDALLAVYIIEFCPGNKHVRPRAVDDLRQIANRTLGRFIPLVENDIMAALCATNKFNFSKDGEDYMFIEPKKMHDHMSYYLLNRRNVGDSIWDVLTDSINKIRASLKGHVIMSFGAPEGNTFRLPDGRIFKWGLMESEQ
jgi:hypothetical protein